MKKLLRYIFAFLGAVAFFYLLLNAKIATHISPFGISVMFALMRMIEKNKISLLFSYFLAGLLANLTPLGIIVVVIETMVNFGLILTKRFIRPRFQSLCYGSGLVVCQIPGFFIYSIKGIEALNFGISILLSVLFYYLLIRLVSAVKNRGFKTNLAIDEIFGICVLIVGLTLGAESINFYDINFALIITMLALMLLSGLSKISPVIFYSASAGIAYMLAFNQYNYFVIFIVWAMCIVGLRNAPKIVSVSILIIIDLFLGLVFKVYGNYTLINFLIVVLCSALYVSIPKKIDAKFKNFFEFVKPTERQLDIYFRQSVKQKLTSFVGLLYDIDATYKDMVIPLNSFNRSKTALCKEVCKRVCKDCINRKTCYEKARIDIESAVEHTLEIGIKKGEIKAIDLPNVLVRCSNYSLMVGYINNATRRYLGLVKEANAGNLGKIAIGNQLKGVADALSDFNNAMQFESRADRALEENYLSELLYNNIIADDCQIIISEDRSIKSITIVLKLTTNKEKLLKVSQKFFKMPMKISESKYSQDSGWQIVTLSKKPKYGFVFGSATVGHNGRVVNGDSHSCTKLAGDRFLLSIADGKGHGKEAEKTSNTTMKLIENFFKANISTETVVTSVNQILSFNSSENFSAVDLCIVNLNDGEADFVKLGSTPTLIKRGDKVRVISGSGLPMGVSKMATSSYDSEFLSVGDIVVMTSDGVFDSFETTENFAGFVNNLRIYNMDFLAKSLLEESVRLSGGKIKDDLTVVAFRWLADF